MSGHPAQDDRELLAAAVQLKAALLPVVNAALQAPTLRANPRLATGALLLCLSDVVERHPEIAPDSAELTRWFAAEFDDMAAQFAAFTDTPTPQPAA